MSDRPQAAHLTVAECATDLGVSEAVVLCWIGTGELSAANVARAATAKRLS